MSDPDFGAAAVLGEWSPEPDAKPILPPHHEGQPEFPAPGIYFGMDEEEYHSIPALSASGLKKISTSTMNFWAESWLNLDREEREEKFFNYGKAIHAFVLEGEGAYLDRFAVDLDPADFADQRPLIHTEQIKAAIGAFKTTAPVTPKTGKQDLIDQLGALGERDEIAVDLEGTVADLKERIRKFSEEVPVKPVRIVEEVSEDGEVITRPASKPDWIAQLQALDPNVKIWDAIVSEYRAQHEGKQFIDAKSDRRIRIAAKMIMDHPEIGKAIEGGFPEVSIFWHCKRTGAPMKARLDMLKMRVIADLKSFTNKQGKPIRSAINTAIASYKYNMQHVVYIEAVMAARELIRKQIENGENLGAVIHESRFQSPQKTAKLIEWCVKWATQEQPPEFLFIFQQSGVAPVTRGLLMPRNTLYSVTRSRVEELKRQWVEAASTFGTDPWLDLAPISEIEDEEIPDYATDIGRIEV